MVKPYLRTEWGVQYDSDPLDIWVIGRSGFLAREIVEDYNRANARYGLTAKVVQRSISDWGEDE